MARRAAPTAPLQALRGRLKARVRPDERVSPFVPEDLPVAALMADRWPDLLRAGVIEPRRGYRFRPENLSVPALFTSMFPDPANGPGLVVDLGSGSGSLLMAAAWVLRPRLATGVEVQAEMADRLRRTVDAHQQFLPGVSLQVVQGDLRDPSLLEQFDGRADLVIANPPFFASDWGQPSARASTHRSTHALAGGVADFLQAASRVAGPGGSVLLLYDAGRLAEALAAAGRVGLGVVELNWLSDSKAPGEPYRVWTVLRRGAAPISEL